MAGSVEITRRSFLGGRRDVSGFLVRPPGTNALGLEACTECGECVKACPTQIIVLKNGLPEIDFSGGECLFCGECQKACPEPVFVAQLMRYEHVVAIDSSCLPKSGVTCQSCRDVCPEQAVRFLPRIGGPFLPKIDVDACSGCGACIGVCPTNSIAPIKHVAENIHA